MSQATIPTDEFLINGRNGEICVNMSAVSCALTLYTNNSSYNPLIENSPVGIVAWLILNPTHPISCLYVYNEQSSHNWRKPIPYGNLV